MKRIPEIINDCINRLKPTSAITGIIDNFNNTYTITFASFSKSYLTLSNDNVIEITNTVGFNGKYKISNLTANSFDIKKNIGITIPAFGEWILSEPYYYFSDVKEYAKKIAHEHGESSDLGKELFPAVYLNPNMLYREISRIYLEVDNVKITLLDWTKLDSNYPQRYANEMPYLFELYEKLTQKIIQHENIENPEFSYEPFCFAKIEGNEIVNAIEITLKTKINNKTC